MEEAEHLQDNDEELEEGPPPGFHSIQSTQIIHQETQIQSDDVIDDDELKGPPPGFPTPPPLSSDACMEEEKPQGYPRFTPEPPTPPETPLVTAVSSDIKEKRDGDSIEDEDDGPPPGWNLIPPQQGKSPKVSPSSLSTTISTDMDSRRKDTRNESVNLPYRHGPAIGQNSSPSACLSKAPESTDTSETGFHQGHKFAENNGHQSKRQTVSPSQNPTSMQVPPSACTTPSEPEMGQLVCGTCRQLLSYPRGAKYVKCAKCQEVNLVLEEHEVGQVRCGGCMVLLMYPYGSPVVRCSSCRFATSIGTHNRRPPLSEQQARARARAHRRPRAARVNL